MLIKPRQIEPGYQRRWIQETVELLKRAPEIWTLLAIVFCAMGYVAYPFLGTGQGLLGVFQVYVVVHLAQVVAERDAHLLDIVRAFRQAGPRTVTLFRQARRDVPVLIVIGMCLVGIVSQNISYLLGHATPASELLAFNPASIRDWLVWRHSPLFCCCYGVMWGITMGGPVFLVATGMFEVQDVRLIRRLCVQGLFLNPQALRFAMVASVGLLFAGYLVAVLGPFASIAFPLFSFVVARDVFLHGNGNRKREKKAARRLATTQIA